MENERDLCSVEEICIKVRVYHLLHRYNRTRRSSMAIGEFLFTIRTKACWWNIIKTRRYLRISKNGKMY